MRNLVKELEFLHLAENLKKEMRHCWDSEGRRESVAEHSWRLALMVFRFSEQLDHPVDLLKCLEMARIHDLPEAIAGDLPLTLQTVGAKALQLEKEREAIARIKSLLEDKNGQEIYDLWHEYEDQVTYESRFLKALDKVEAFIQHNEAPLHTWEHKEKQMLFDEAYLVKYCKFDTFLLDLAHQVIRDGVTKLEAAGEDLAQFRTSRVEIV